jgi:hypothetical protein
MASSMFKEKKETGMEPDETSYVAAAKDCIGADLPTKVIDIFDDMYMKGFLPDVHLCNSVVIHCHRRSNPTRAALLISKMETWKVKVSESTYREAVLACTEKIPTESKQDVQTHGREIRARGGLLRELLQDLGKVGFQLDAATCMNACFSLQAYFAHLIAMSSFCVQCMEPDGLV